MRSRSLGGLMAVLVVIVVAWFLISVLAPRGGSDEVTVKIPRGASARDIARILAEQGIVRSEYGFRLLTNISGESTSLKPGAYVFSPSMTPRTVLKKIASGEVSAHWVTFPEGFTIKQIAERLEAERFADSERFRELAEQGGDSFERSFPIPLNSLEGYLFPDTYLAHIGETEEAIIENMLDVFERKVLDPLADEIAASGMSLHEIITLASLIEREARIPEDRALISATLRNRLGRNMRLECDATVLYALGEHKSRVLYRDLEVDSPYNTYRRAGLPPGPIANPGLASIEAALRPANVDYLYYVARPNGSHIFSRTFEQHKHAIRVARRENAQ